MSDSSFQNVESPPFWHDRSMPTFKTEAERWEWIALRAVERRRVAEEEARALRAQVRDLEEARGELLGLVDSPEFEYVPFNCDTCRDTGQVASSWGTPEFGGGSLGACPDCKAWQHRCGVAR